MAEREENTICLYASYLWDYMDAWGHLVGKEETNKKKKTKFTSHIHIYNNMVDFLWAFCELNSNMPPTNS